MSKLSPLVQDCKNADDQMSQWASHYSFPLFSQIEVAKIAMSNAGLVMSFVPVLYVGSLCICRTPEAVGKCTLSHHLVEAHTPIRVVVVLVAHDVGKACFVGGIVVIVLIVHPAVGLVFCLIGCRYSE